MVICLIRMTSGKNEIVDIREVGQKYSKKSGGENLPKGIMQKDFVKNIKLLPGQHSR